jgi:multicomponent Na+:H+ antiporter subunit G
MLAIVGEVLLAVLLLAGSLLSLLAAIGLHRFPDVFCRMHAATKPATLGLALVAIAVGLLVTAPGSAVKLLLVVVLQFLTVPAAAHMVGRAAYLSGGLMSDLTVMDELGRDSRADIDGPAQ